MTDIEAVVERCANAWIDSVSNEAPDGPMKDALAALRPGDPLPGGNVVAQGWRSIEEAPRDGSFFVAYYNDTNGPPFGPMSWIPKINEKTGEDEGRFHSWATGTRTARATHWSPPTPEASDG